MSKPKPPKPPIALQIDPAWKQQPGEPDVWFHRFNRWLWMVDPNQELDYVSSLNQYAQRLGVSLPEYTFTSVATSNGLFQVRL